VARDDQRQWIGAVGPPDRPHCRRLTNRPRDLAVGPRLAKGRLGHRRPDPALERRATRVEPEVERPPPAAEVLRQLRQQLGQRVGILDQFDHTVRLRSCPQPPRALVSRTIDSRPAGPP
jgi:hypothetical protein